MERAKIDFWVGLFVIGGMVALLVLALKVGNLTTFGTDEGYVVYAEFENIGGLKVRAPIKSAGVVVGRVSDISFNNETFAARVALRLDSHYKFPRDTAASILTSGLLGEQYIGLEAGGDLRNLEPGEQIRLTQSAVVLEKLIGQFLYNKASESATRDDQ